MSARLKTEQVQRCWVLEPGCHTVFLPPAWVFVILCSRRGRASLSRAPMKLIQEVLFCFHAWLCCWWGLQVYKVGARLSQNCRMCVPKEGSACCAQHESRWFYMKKSESLQLGWRSPKISVGPAGQNSATRLLQAPTRNGEISRRIFSKIEEVSVPSV